MGLLGLLIGPWEARMVAGSSIRMCLPSDGGCKSSDGHDGAVKSIIPGMSYVS